MLRLQTPFALGRIVTRGPRESSSVYSVTLQTLGVDVEKVIPLVALETRPSVEITFASKKAPLIGTEAGAITLTRVAWRRKEIVCDTGFAAKKESFPD